MNLDRIYDLANEEEEKAILFLRLTADFHNWSYWCMTGLILHLRVDLMNTNYVDYYYLSNGDV